MVLLIRNHISVEVISESHMSRARWHCLVFSTLGWTVSACLASRADAKALVRIWRLLCQWSFSLNTKTAGAEAEAEEKCVSMYLSSTHCVMLAFYDVLYLHVCFFHVHVLPHGKTNQITIVQMENVISLSVIRHQRSRILLRVCFCFVLFNSSQ